ncbi:MAG TPA: DUF2304 domain-containing protein [bacterium]|nr:DUF2304 domain-containing protein [bacterium]
MIDALYSVPGGTVMPLTQKIFAVIFSVLFLYAIFEIVRKRRLLEQYSVIWLALGTIMLVLGLWYDALLFVTRLIGAGFTSSTLFFFGITICLLLNLQASFELSRNATHIKNLTQEVALLKHELEEKQKEMNQ